MKKVTNILDENGRELISRFDNNGDGTVERVERRTWDDAGNIIRTDFDRDADSRTDRTTFDDDADGTVDRAEQIYWSSRSGPLYSTSFDDDNDDDIDRRHVDTDGDGVLDRIFHYERDDRGKVTRYEYDKDADGAWDQVTLYMRDDNGVLVELNCYDLPFSYEPASSTPFTSVRANYYAAPAFADVDGDGDKDLVVGDRLGKLRYFENTGGVTAPAFTERPGTDGDDNLNPFYGIDVGSNAAPVFVDLDQDGDPDLAAGRNNGQIRYYKNTGSADNPTFVEQTGTADSDDPNPFHGFDAGARSAPTFVDLDGDGDLDLVVGNNSDGIRYYKNTGSARLPTFTEQTGVAGSDNPNPFRGIDAGASAAPTFVDEDSDGDWDLVVGNFDGVLKYYENTGSAAEPTFEARTGVDNPFDDLDVGRGAAPVFADLGRDPVPELVIGTREGKLAYHTLGNFLSYAYTRDEQGRTIEIHADLDWDGAVDWSRENVRDDKGRIIRIEYDDDADGRLIDRTYFYGDANGSTARWEHYEYNADGKRIRTEVDKEADRILDWVEIYTLDAAGARTGVARYDLPLSYETVAGDLSGAISQRLCAVPAFADLDGDGDLDLVVGEFSGVFRYFENTGGNKAPVFEERAGNRGANRNPFTGFNVGYDAAPTFADVNGDGNLDLVAGEDDGQIRYYKRTGDAATLTFVRQTGTANPFSAVDVGEVSSPVLVDLDGDDDLDLAVGNSRGDISYYENTGDVENPMFEAKTVAENPFAGIDAGDFAAPSFTDWDGDGDWDLVVGRNDGDLGYYENTGDAERPTFGTEAAVNPFDGIDVGERSAPTFADLDGDLLPELVVGAGDGNIKHHRPTASRIETYALDELGRVVRTDFDTDADGTVDRVEHYTLDDNGRQTHARVDSDADGTVDHLDLYTLDDNGLRTRVETYNLPLSYEVADALFEAVDRRATPTFVDLDGDDDFDLVAGERPGNIRYFENTGSATAPEFEEQEDATGANLNPFHGINVGRHPSPAFADLNQDGKVDLVISDRRGKIYYFENTGSITAPEFTPRTGAKSDDNPNPNPFHGFTVEDYGVSTFVDLDDDNDLDLVVGDEESGLYYFENTTGNDQMPEFTPRTGANSDDNPNPNPFHGIVVEYDAAPSFVDVDRDGDLDLVVGRDDGDFRYYENTGSAKSAAFASEPETGDANPFDGIDVGASSTPTFVDLDGDQMLELVSGRETGEILYYKPAPPVRIETYVLNTAGLATQTHVDTDGDGDIDQVYFDPDADGVNDRIEHHQQDEDGRLTRLEIDRGANGRIDIIERYTFDEDDEITTKTVEHRDSNGVAVKTEFDDNANGTVDRVELDEDADGTVDRIEHIKEWNAAGVVTRRDIDRDGDGTIDVIERCKADVNGVALQKTYTRPASANSHEKIEFFNELGRQSATATDADTDMDVILDTLDYDSRIEVTSRIVVATSGPVAGDIDAKDLVGVSRINLAGAGAGSTDLTISVEALKTLAKGAGSYQLSIHGDGNDVLRFDRGEFDEEDDVTIDGVVYERYAGEIGSFIVEPDSVTLDAVRTVRTDHINQNGHVGRSDFDVDGDGVKDRGMGYVRNTAGQVVRTRFDDDGDGTDEREETDFDADGTLDKIEYFREWDAYGWVTRLDRDRDADGAIDVTRHATRDDDRRTVRIEFLPHDPEGRGRIEYLNEWGEYLAVITNSDAGTASPVHIGYDGRTDVASEIVAQFPDRPAVGMVDASDLVGVPLLELAGAAAGSTDLTISAASLRIMAGDDDSYQLRITGDSEDALRFSASEFTEGAAVSFQGENFRQFTVTTGNGSFIVDPDVMLVGGGIERNDVDEDGDGAVDRSEFDVDGDDTDDRVEHYTRDAGGRLARVEFDNDGDGTTDIIKHHKFNGDSHIVQKTYKRPDASHEKTEFFGEWGVLLATATNVDDDAALDRLDYESGIGVVSEVVAAVPVPVVRRFDANDLVGVTHINLAGAGAGSTDLTISADALGVLAGSDDDYQLRIDGDGGDTLRFTASEFTAGSAVIVDGENYRQYTGTTDSFDGSFIVDPEVALVIA